MKLGIIEEGVLKDRRIILSPRKGLKDNEYMVENGKMVGDNIMFSKFCLICDIAIPDQGCNKHYENIKL